MMETVRMPDSTLFHKGRCTVSCWKTWKMCNRKWQEKNIAGKNKTAGLEKPICLLAPLWVGRAGRNEHLSGKYRPIEKRLHPDAIGRESCFLQLCEKWESILISQRPACKCRAGRLLLIISVPTGRTIIKGTNLSGRRNATGHFFWKMLEAALWKDRGHLPQGINRTE